MVNGEVLTDVSFRGLPHEGSFGRVELDQQAAVAVWRSEGGAIGHRLVQPGGNRVDFRSGGDGSEGRNALSVFDQKGERG